MGSYSYTVKMVDCNNNWTADERFFSFSFSFCLSVCLSCLSTSHSVYVLQYVSMFYKQLFVYVPFELRTSFIEKILMIFTMELLF